MNPITLANPAENSEIKRLQNHIRGLEATISEQANTISRLLLGASPVNPAQRSPADRDASPTSLVELPFNDGPHIGDEAQLDPVEFPGN